MKKVSIIIPVVRKDKAARCREAIRKNAGVGLNQYEVVMQKDVDGIGCPAMVKQLTASTLYDLVMFLGDDTIPEPEFLLEALRVMDTLPDGWGVVGLNTQGPMFGHRPEGVPKNSNPLAHWMADKRMLEHIPGGDFFSTDYKHCWCDNELKDIADEMGRWAFAVDAKVEHDHPVNTGEKLDDNLKKAYSTENQKHDKKTYFRRKIDRMRSRTGIKLALAYPVTYEIVYAPFCFTNLNIVCQYITGSMRNGVGVPPIEIITPTYPGNHDAVRNNLVEQALKSGCTHILMMDTDQVYYDPDTIQKLLDHNKPVVGARVHRRYPPFDPMLLMQDKDDGDKYRHMDYEEINRIVDAGETIKVPATGCGCILYETRVFLDIDPPWFLHTKTAAGRTKGEDVYFCEQLKRSGYDIYVDTSINIAHLTMMEIGMDTYRLYQGLHIQQIKKLENEVNHG